MQALNAKAQKLQVIVDHPRHAACYGIVDR